MSTARAGAFLTLLAIALAAPSTSRADCRHPGDRPSIGLDVDAFRAEAPSDDLAPLPPPKPCDGPQCSGKTASPMTPAPQPPPRAESWGQLLAPAPILGPEPGSPTPEDSPERPVHQAGSIFHPPRLPR
ncbi:hypothetical protein P12x_005818 [Tundrisphaera lichenicola]|uniref:hypothetical protein n=1 Tax=Tundrisphaera lichenicola TaxID=2029860 RepID=UPI003EBECF42